VIHRRLTTSSLLPAGSARSSGCGASIQTSRLMMPITVSRYARRRWNGMVQFRGSEIDATPDEPDDATFTAARAVGATYATTTSIGKLAKERMRLLSFRTGTPGLIVTTLAARADSTAFPSRRANPIPAQAWTPWPKPI
jgi:hypothetical protein